MKAKSMSEAKELGLTRYFTGEPCAKAGHIAERATSNGVCCECKRLRAIKNYHENIKAERARQREKQKRLYAKNPEKFRALAKAYYEKNKEIVQAKARIRSAEWREVNPSHEGTKQAKRHWKSSNRGYAKISKMKRTEATRLRIPQWLTEDDFWMMEEAYDIAKVRTELFGFKWDVDHILPLLGKYVSGLHVPSNLQVIPQIENLRKSNKYIPQ